MNNELEEIAGILRELFEEYEGPVTRELSARDVAQWDSLANVQFVVRIEHEFGIRFGAREVSKFKNIGELIDMVRIKRGKSK